MGSLPVLVGTNVFRRANHIAILVSLLALAACTQIPATFELTPAIVDAPPTATEAVSDTATTSAAEDAAPDTQTPTVVAALPAAPAFVLPTATPRVPLQQSTNALTPTATSVITQAFLTATATLTGTSVPTVTTDLPAFILPTATPHLIPTSTPPSAPMARVLNSINVRSGPGTNYPVIAGFSPDARVEIVGRDAASEWWHVRYNDGATGWLSAPLVEVEGDATRIDLATDIPTPPPFPSPAPVVPTADTAFADTPAPALPPPASTSGAAEFRVVNKRLWDVYENGGSLDGPSVTCGEKRQLVVTVLDAAGNRLNGVAVQAEYGAREVFITGAGKGDGNVEFVLGSGQDVKVIRDSDGSEAISEMATGLSTNPAAIPFDQLIQARYCTDAENCQRFVDAPGCYGHFSWTVTFQRDR